MQEHKAQISGFIGGQYKPLSDEDVKRIHEASLAILARTGVQLLEAEALQLFKDAGAAAASEQTAFAQMVQRHYTQLATKPLHELVQEHQRLGKPTASSWGISDYAWSIASHRADIEMSNIHDTQARSLREASAARALLKSEGLATA